MKTATTAALTTKRINSLIMFRNLIGKRLEELCYNIDVPDIRMNK